MGIFDFLFGSKKETTSIPDWVAKPAQQNIAQAQRVAGLGYVPYYGPDVAAFNPMQEAAFKNTNSALSAFGMAAPSNPMAGMPKAQTFAGGVQGYSSAPMYRQAVGELKDNNPNKYAMLMSVLDGFRQQASQAHGTQGATQALTPIQLLQQRVQGSDYSPIPPSKSNNSFNTIGSYLPGGVNTANPSSLLNTIAASLTSGTQKPPTAADRPKARP